MNAFFADIDNFQITPSASTVTALDVGDRSSGSVLVKAHPDNTSRIFVGRSTNRAGSALSDTTGYPLAAGESVSLDLIMGEDKIDGSYPAVYTTGSSQKVCVLVLHP